MLCVNGLKKGYNQMEVLKGISFTVEEGDLVSIIGPSGCGKSTLLRCLNCLEILDEGEMEVAGVRISRRHSEPIPRNFSQLAHNLRQKVGMVFQQFNLFPHMTIRENVAIAPRVVLKLPEEEVQERARELLRKVGLEDRMEYYPSQLSGGQQQRAAIARALAMKPRLMLYDEPTSSLDPELVEEVLQVMRNLDAEGMTQIIVTHEMKFARDASDYIIFMDEGQIVEISDEDEIFLNPKDERTRKFLNRWIKE
ncbi:MAG: amino acid ABC transporter ATP-binding protein [Chthoniobacterales bacterium]|nr:amino acid ABC transporter ATP-binding protein [Chthoniobacterales bacterium]